MSWKKVFAFVFFLFVVSSLVLYWILPLGDVIEFGISGERNYNFTSDNSTQGDVQFYPNMRYVTSNISYKIMDCPLGKADEMERAFDLVENLTILEFYEVQSNEEISVSCEDETRTHGRTFIAGEGGVTNVTTSGEFNVIFNGKVLLLRESNCATPIVGTHELIHSLGFEHSHNKNNIMYPTVMCQQEVGQDTIDLIDYLYSVEPKPDLEIESANVSMQGRYLDAQITVRNEGLENSKESKLIIYADDKQIKDFEIEPLQIGSGRIITLTNILVRKISVEEIKLSIEYNYEEMNSDNNELFLKIKE